MVDDVYSECKTEEEIASRMKWMIDCVEIQAKFSTGYLKTETNRVLTHEDICRTAAELAYEEHMKQTMLLKSRKTVRITIQRKE